MQESTEAQAAFASARWVSLQGRGVRQASPDLGVGSGCYEIARQVLGRAPGLLTRFIGFLSFMSYGSGVSMLHVAIQQVAVLPQ